LPFTRRQQAGRPDSGSKLPAVHGQNCRAQISRDAGSGRRLRQYPPAAIFLFQSKIKPQQSSLINPLFAAAALYQHPRRRKNPHFILGVFP
jgi:hypothetical protein